MPTPADALPGRTIRAVRPMTPAECAAEGWEHPALALILDNGTVLYPSRDDEGNGPGAFFGATADGRHVAF
jgi:hypothetical protein